VAANEGRLADAESLVHESLEVARAHGVLFWQSRMLQVLTTLALWHGDHDAAAKAADESLAAARGSDDAWSIALALNSAGDVARLQDDYERA
jgi:hypothetical protein